ncbi:MAG TPA: sodium:proton antiporter [Crocinitomicaceae bacterium]|nr:sodium:proton antiporter [Crocinitomicaceae bacterium]
MEIYFSFSLLIVVATLFSFLNHQYLKLPSTIGIMIIAIFFSIVLVTFGDKILSKNVLNFLRDLPKGLDFSEILMGVLLNFLLFAGGIHIKISDLREHRGAIGIFATLSVVMTAFFVAFAIYFISSWVHAPMEFIHCLLFGALIAPTDPIAVLGVLKEAKVEKSLQIKVAGESLFNDGTAIVFFIVVLQIATGSDSDISFFNITWFFIQEFFGGILVGLLLGILAKKVIKITSDYKIAVMSTLSIVMGGYVLCRGLHVSAPLAMVSAGLFIGNLKFSKAKNSEELTDYLHKFWEVIDEIFNAILFLFIGLEVIIITDLQQYWKAGFVAIIVVLLARFLSIYIPSKTIRYKKPIDNHTIKVLTWGGIRGGVSIALALSIPATIASKEAIVAITYFVVVFSIVVQGLTIGSVANKKKLKIPRPIRVNHQDEVISEHED